ncbi:MAG: SRPBCC domain-containing protein [Longimicrobiales bacterium]
MSNAVKNIGGLEVWLPSDREIAMTREFAAPRSLVWDCHTKPELVKRWMGVIPGWSWAVCDIDLRVGGKYRFVWRNTDGGEMGMGGEYREIAAPSRMVAKE